MTIETYREIRDTIDAELPNVISFLDEQGEM